MTVYKKFEEVWTYGHLLKPNDETFIVDLYHKKDRNLTNEEQRRIELIHEWLFGSAG